ncbi:MAG: PRC-barrel domain-containing protein [Candidatus Methanomethylophilaceae archaeon]|nr:PRC-barrel domain-containing protein [Candidatus Methanomethylophilaceae archaeon]
MLETADNLKGLEIYTPNGVFVGVVDEIILNISEMKAESLFVNSANPALVDDNVSIAIPMRWVQSVGDIIILNAFPERVNKPVKE